MIDKINYQEIFSKKTQEKRPKRILVSNKEGYSYIPIEEIAWFEAEDKCIFIITIDGNKRLTDLKSLNDISQILDFEEFFQISRSVVASIKSIKNVFKYFKSRLLVELSAGGQTKRETISAARKLQFLNWLGHI